jgi:hypothetical protein
MKPPLKNRPSSAALLKPRRRNRHGFCISAPVGALTTLRLRKNRAGSGVVHEGLAAVPAFVFQRRLVAQL